MKARKNRSENTVENISLKNKNKEKKVERINRKNNDKETKTNKKQKKTDSGGKTTKEWKERKVEEKNEANKNEISIKIRTNQGMKTNGQNKTNNILLRNEKKLYMKNS